MAPEQGLRIGSRGSKLAVVQAEWVGAQLKKSHPDLEITYVRMTTTGDKNADTPLQQMGGKGVFVKEIEDALIKNDIDLAVHSLKDVPQTLPLGLTLGPYPKREDPREVLISRFGEHLHELPRGSIVGTSSPRRMAQIKHKFKKRQYRLEPLRGNVETRLKKLKDGQYDAIVLALAGLKRLGLDGEASQILDTEELMPAPGQGCLGLELRQDDERVLRIIQSIRHDVSDLTARAERSFLQAIGGDCLAPLASRVAIIDKEIRMEALLLDLEGENIVLVKEAGLLTEPELVGAKLAGRLLYEGAELFAKIDSQAGHAR